MSDRSPLENQWLLLRRLLVNRNGMTIQDMMRELDAKERTVRRYLQQFKDMQIPLEEAIGEKGKKTWRLRKDYSIPIGLNYEQAFALYLGRKLLEPLAGTPFWKASREAFELIKTSLDRGPVGYLDQMAESFHATSRGAGDYSDKEDIVDELMRGIEESKAVMIAYQSQNMTEPATRDVYPYGIAYHNGSLYLVAFSPEHRQVRHYKIDRVTEAEVTEIPFNPPDDFRMDKYLERSFGVFQGDGETHVAIRFDPSVAQYVLEKKWHGTQKITRLKDGGLRVEITLSSTEEVKHWILSFGSKAIVLEPEFLREEVCREIETMFQHYQQTSEPRDLVAVKPTLPTRPTHSNRSNRSDGRT
ncbi:MAG: WYL domain-containing protein [Planctomycetota bacterium]